MSKKSVYCVAEVESQALDIINRLKDDGFSNDEISILFPVKTAQKGLTHARFTPASQTLGAMGIEEYEADIYRDRIKVGGILISVHPGDEAEVPRVKDIFESFGAKAIAATGEANHPKKGERHLSAAAR